MCTQFSVFVCWATIGAMLFFGSVVAPVVFKTLSPEDAGRFLRRLFPRLYLFCGLMTGLSAILFAVDLKGYAVAASACVSALFFWTRGPLTNAINAARDAQLAGDVDAGERFDRLHKVSTRIFGVQLIILLTLGLWLGLA